MQSFGRNGRSEVATALGCAHGAGLVHCNIKPTNILIGSDGQVKVTDFGPTGAMNAASTLGIERVGSEVGATYFSPEQAEGVQPDSRSDLYSLGVVMYEMVAGQPPFTGETAASIADKHLRDSPQPMGQLAANVPRPYEAIVAKLLAKSPDARYNDANSLRDDLHRFRDGQPVLAADAPPAQVSAQAPASGYVFVSYHRSDRNFVDRLTAELRARGITVWVDDEIDYGDRWERVIKAQIEGCAAFLVVMTPAAEESRWVSREIIHAEELSKPLFPVLLAGERFFRLSDIQFDDVRTGRKSTGDSLPPVRFYERLAEVVTRHN